jgi:hypothetical protein
MLHLKKIAFLIMPFYSESQIRKYHAEFVGLKKYTDKLIFFDRLFGIIPFSFPDFDPRLSYFFQREKTDELAGIFKLERNNPGLTEKKFSYGEDFVFGIRPANSNSAVYSNFILSSFLSRAPVFTDWIQQKKTTERPVEVFLDEANGMINQIEYNLQYEREKGFTLQCMAVFYKGFFDAFSNRVYGPGKKRKFIELYLYAQGIIYANYISSLKTALQQSHHPLEAQYPLNLDLSGKLRLMYEQGIIDFMKTKYAGMDTLSWENQIAETLCLIMGEDVHKKAEILQILSHLSCQGQKGSSNAAGNKIHQQILRLAMGK